MRILDPTCSIKSIWFNDNDPDVVHCDIRVEEHKLKDRVLVIKPHVQMDYTAMPFSGECFDMVVFDPPHLTNLGLNSWMAKKYGKLFANWHDNIRSGFSECWRVLKNDGSLVFKWSERDIKLVEVLALAPCPPLFGHQTGQNTIWTVFVKR